MHRAQPLRFAAFGAAGDPLVALERELSSRQVKYLRCYLHDLGARSVVIEPNYFDRDYLSEFSAFYATSSAGYSNICRRVHYFSELVTRANLAKAVGGDAKARAVVEQSYLGHVILRPIPGATVGRTVLCVYSDEAGIAAGTPRVMQPAREYEAHVAGLTLKVSGLAWQQQDSAVGSCATVALWSMLHSSAYDDHHAIPTTAQITSMAHWSGYPVLVNGWLEEEERSGHAVCIVGFRSPAAPEVRDGEYVLADEDIEVVYVHDDNLGPNTRFRIDTSSGTVSLVPDSPEPRRGRWPTLNPTTAYHEITPTEIVVAVHQELRTDPSELQRAAVRYSTWLPSALDHEAKHQGTEGSTGMVVGSRFIRLREYVEDELASALRGRAPTVLARARLALWEQVAPMSLHIGLVRVSLGIEPMMDILFDTSDSDRHLQPTAYVAFQPQVPWLLKRWRELIEDDLELGTLVRAW